MIPAQWGVSLALRELQAASVRKATTAVLRPSSNCSAATRRGKRQPQQGGDSAVPGRSSFFWKMGLLSFLLSSDEPLSPWPMFDV
jgi:hypothetical protein